jgi:hypothetical protein
MGVLKGKKLHSFQMKNKLGEEKEKNCSPITKERDVGEENNLH